MIKKIKFLFYDMEIPYLLNDDQVQTGGACVRMFIFSKGLMEQGHKVGILSFEGANKYVKNNKGLDIIDTYNLNKGLPMLRWLYYRIPNLFNKIRQYKPDVFISKSPGHMLGITAIICKLLKVKLVYMVTSDIMVDGIWQKKTNLSNRIFHRIGLLFANSIFCQNDYQLKQVNLKYSDKKAFKIINPYLEINNEIAISNSQNRKYISWIGSFRKPKNVPALYRIAVENPQYIFKIAGKEGGNIDENIQTTIEKLKALENVIFTGYMSRKQLPKLLFQSIALLNTSFYEGFSNTFLEAFSVGTPVISLFSNPDSILTKNKIGFVVDENRIDKTIKNILQQQQKDALATNIKNYVANYHDYKKLSKELSNQILLLIS
jgi:glycosyltransferase involved in cell wall biosynthesis